MASFINIIQHAYLQEFRKSLSPVLKTMESYARHNRVPILDWHSAEMLEFLVASNKPEKILEIGTAIGYSAIRIAQLLPEGGQITTIEKRRRFNSQSERVFRKGQGY